MINSQLKIQHSQFTTSSLNPHILLTIDVEDWFQVENFKKCIPFSSWSGYELRVERNTHCLLDLLDSVSVQTPINPTNSIDPSNSMNPKATFFILGWIAERLPHLVREIYERGHEVASHGYCHELCSQCSWDQLKGDLEKSKKLLEDIIGQKIYGYRAPSFSINNEALKMIQDSGYLYDSSYNSFAMNNRYGRVDLPEDCKRGLAYRLSDAFYELPISNLEFRLQTSNFKLQTLIIPWGGGGYFRMIPFPVFKWGVQSVLRKEMAYLFYCHPWEVDPVQPKLGEATFLSKFRHYINIENTQTKLIKFLNAFSESFFLSCKEYLKSISPSLCESTPKAEQGFPSSLSPAGHESQNGDKIL